MTAKERIEGEMKLIDEFMGYEGEINFSRKWGSFDELDKVIMKIQYLGYSYILSSAIFGDKIHHACGFSKASEPFDLVNTDGKCTNRLAAIKQAVVKFITHYNELIQKSQTVSAVS